MPIELTKSGERCSLYWLNLCFLLLQCEFVSGLGFRAGSYKCVCRPGYFFPNVTDKDKYFNGSEIEAQAANSKTSYHSNPDSFKCLKCQPGCDTCVDDSPCIVTLSWPLRQALMGLTVLTILSAFGMMIFVIYVRELKVRWRLLVFQFLGTIQVLGLVFFLSHGFSPM